MQLVENTNTTEIYNQDSGPIGRQLLHAPIFHAPKIQIKPQLSPKNTKIAPFLT